MPKNQVLILTSSKIMEMEISNRNITFSEQLVTVEAKIFK